MKIIVIADVHGNLSALKGLEKQEEFKSADMVISLGDMIVDYSRPNECIEWLLDNAKCILGNNDAFVCDHIPLRGLSSFSARKIKQIKFMSSIVSDDNKKKVMALPKELRLEIDEIKFYFCHYYWDCEDDCIVDGGEKSLYGRKKLFGNIECDYLFFAHEHNLEHYFDGKTHYYLTPSLGLRNPSRYYVIDIVGGSVSVKEKSYLHDFDIENRLEYELVKKNENFFIK